MVVQEQQDNDRLLRWLIALVGILVTFSVYSPVLSADFVNYDDDVYVSENPHLGAGLNLKSLRWAATAVYHATWQPVTWLSYLADVELFGLTPFGFHLTNLLLHLASVALLLFSLHRLTGQLWASALVAGLFGLHPLNVESVAWIAERKGVCSTFFWMLSLWLWTGYLRRQTAIRYLAVASSFAMGLMAKPMLVSLPLVFMLLDFWPAQRNLSWKQSLWEKAPLLAMSLLMSLVAFLAQHHGQAVADLHDLSLGGRLANAAVSAATYLWKMLFPGNLAVFYGHPVGGTPTLVWVSSLSLLVAISAVACWKMKSHAWLFVGWCWYLIVLAPVSGLVQIGTHARADRYAYLPLVGIFLILASGARVWSSAGGVWRARVISFVAVAWLAGLGWTTWHQVAFWHNSRTLFEHAMKVSPQSPRVHNQLGLAMLVEGDLDRAAKHLQMANRLRPGDARILNNLGLLYRSQGRMDLARQAFEESVRRDPRYGPAHNNLAILWYKEGEYEKAWQHLRMARDNGTAPHPDFIKALQKRKATPDPRD